MLEVVHKYIAPQWLTSKRLVVFEDQFTAGHLFPLNVLRPSWEIRSGLGSLGQWLAELRRAGYSVSLRPRSSLTLRSRELAGFDDDWPSEQEPIVFLNGRVLHLPATKTPLPEAVVDSFGQVLWAKLDGKTVSELSGSSGTLLAESLVKVIRASAEISTFGGEAAHFIWDYMALNQKLLAVGMAGEYKELMGSGNLEVSGGVQIVGTPMVFAGDGTVVMPGVVFDTTEGPVWIGRDTVIEPHCYLKGPLALGDHCRVKAGAAIYGASTFGPHCRISGEISASVMQGYCNKQHSGFLGNSHLGEWVNLGADTTVSNLRNDYGNVKVKVNQKLVDSGRQFVGLICGDHTKTGINTMFNTGSVVGIGCNVYGGGYPPRFIRSFSWGGSDGFHVEPFERTAESARLVMSRRGRNLTEAEIELMKEHYSNIVKQEN